MHEHFAHADQVYASAQSAAAKSPIAASWRRCMTMYHLVPEERRLPVRLTEQEFRSAREQSGRLVAEAAEEIDRLFSPVGRAGCCLLLHIREGVAPARRGNEAD